MNIKKTRMPLLGTAALLILIFHLMPVSRASGVLAEAFRFFVATAYLGVDIFFFLTGYVLTFSRTDDIAAYWKRRILKLYPLFIFFTLAYFLLGRMKAGDILPTLTGIRLFSDGGGAFLWFVPAVMIVYLFAPFYIRAVNRFGNFKTFSVAMTVWVVTMFLLQTFTSNHSGFIFLMRVPMVLLGVLLSGFEGKFSAKKQLAVGIVLLIAGIFLSWSWGYRTRLSVPFTDSYYLAVIPVSLAIILLADLVFGKVSTAMLSFLGKISFESYCVQMTVGSQTFRLLFRFIRNKWIASVSAILVVILLSFVVSLITELPARIKAKKQEEGKQ